MGAVRALIFHSQMLLKNNKMLILTEVVMKTISRRYLNQISIDFSLFYQFLFDCFKIFTDANCDENLFSKTLHFLIKLLAHWCLVYIYLLSVLSRGNYSCALLLYNHL